MSKRITMSDQIIELNDQLARVHNDKNMLVAEANKRINEAYEEGVNSLRDDIRKNEETINSLRELNEKLVKDIESQKSSTKYYSDRNNAMTNDIKNLQDILDVVPGVVARYKNPEDKYSEETPVIVRFASILAAGMNK